MILFKFGYSGSRSFDAGRVWGQNSNLTEIETITGQQDRTEHALPLDRLVEVIR